MINPVLRREIKTSMRSWKTFLAIMMYLILMLSAVGIFISVTQMSLISMGFNLHDSITFYILLTSLQLAFILFISPALTAGSISGERERQTLELMLLTKMSTFSIVFGKLLSSIGIILIMIITSLPIFALVLNYGGITLLNLLSVFGFFIVIAGTMGSAGIFFSTIFKRTSVATVVSYIFLFIICGLNLICYFVAFQMIKYNNYSLDTLNTPQTMNLFSIILGLGTNPIIGFISIIERQLGENYMNMRFLFSLDYYTTSNSISFIQQWIWIINIGINIFISFVFLLLSARNINPVKKKHIKNKRR